MLVSSRFNVLILATLVATAIGDSVDFTLCTPNNLPFKFNLSIRANANTPCNNDPIEDLELLNKNEDTFLLIHGWNDSYAANGSTFKFLKDELVAVGFNVILCQWKTLAAMDYINVETNINIVGKRIADLVMGLNSSGYEPDRVHIVGHWEGAHIAGVIGKQIKLCNDDGIKIYEIKRIFALDPTSSYHTHPLFASSKVLSADNTLDIDDADQIIGMHTNQLSIKTTGTVDFYPNCGISPQPHCSIISNSEEQLRCNHNAAVWYMAMSIRKINYIGKDCNYLSTGFGCVEYWCIGEEVFGINTPSTATGKFLIQANLTKLLV